MNSILQKRFSHKTRPIGPVVGPEKVNRSVTVTMIVACLFDKMAKLWSVSVNYMLRRFIASGAAAENHPMAGELRRALGLPSIHDLTTPKRKAEIFERELREMRPTTSAISEDYLKEFAR
jgi:hypothetical protein